MNSSLPGAIRSVRTAALSALLFAAAASAQTATAARTDLATFADRLFTETYPADEPGAAVLIVHDGKTVLRKGYGMANLELGVPIRPEMVFEIGSVTKQFTAAAILKLAEQGKLALEDDVRKHLPDYPTHGKTITIEHLLTHTSGIPSYTGLPEWQARVREDLTVQQLVGIFQDKPLEFEPGERYSYNNSAYVLLGAVIEKLSGKSYEDFVEQEIFKPLGMNHSRYGSHREVVPGRVDGYDPSPDGYVNTKYLSFASPYAAGSLMTNVDDLLLWDRALSSESLLRKASLDRMFTPVKLSSGASSNYGYGFGILDYAGRQVIEHGGDIFGFTSFLLRIPEERLFITILSNNPIKRTEEMALKIAATAIGQPLEARPSVTLDAKTLDEYVGVYRFAGTTRAITREGSQLFSQRAGSEKQKIFASARDEFFYESSPSRLRFRRDAQGKVTGAELHPRNGADETGTRTNEPLPAERKAVQVDPQIYDAYVGTYELGPGFHLVITREGNQIFVEPTGQPKHELFPESETAFFVKVVDARFVFVRGEGGQANQVVLHQGGREMPAKRVK